VIFVGANFPTIICICSAHRKQGKTQLVMRIVEGLTNKGFKVGTIKHIGGNSSFDSPQAKDTTRHAEAGAQLIVAVTNSEIITINRNEDPTLENALRNFSEDFDFIIVEGFKESSYPRFILIDRAEEIKVRNLNKAGPVLGVTGQIIQNPEELAKLNKNYIFLEETQTDKFISILMERRLKEIQSYLPGMDCGNCGFQDCNEMAQNLLLKKVSFKKCPHIAAKLILEVDGTQIYVKDFVQNILRGSIEGMLQTLKNVPRKPKRIDIHIESNEN